MRTAVGIIGAGPAGLFLARMLEQQGIDCIVLEARSRKVIETTVRAGVLEQGTVDLLASLGVDGRLKREAAVHRGIVLAFDGRRHRINLTGPTGGRAITLYPQNKLVSDLVAARLDSGGDILFDVDNVRLEGLETDRPAIRFLRNGAEHVMRCDFVAGCDGLHGVSRDALPAHQRTDLARDLGLAWCGVLVNAPPASPELIYANHSRGFALVSTRSLSVQRFYVECDPADTAADWSDDRIWTELHARLSMRDGWTLREGPILQKDVFPMRSLVAEPMQSGRLFLAGDAAHIVPPTGAKGLNLAAADARLLARAIAARVVRSDTHPLERYSEAALGRIWRAQHFAWWMTALLHRGRGDRFDRRLQRSQLDYLVGSRAAAASLAENYVGLPFD